MRLDCLASILTTKAVGYSNNQHPIFCLNRSSWVELLRSTSAQIDSQEIA